MKHPLNANTQFNHELATVTGIIYEDQPPSARALRCIGNIAALRRT